jgi:hypothetical protein
MCRLLVPRAVLTWADLEWSRNDTHGNGEDGCLVGVWRYGANEMMLSNGRDEFERETAHAGYSQLLTTAYFISALHCG